MRVRLMTFLLAAGLLCGAAPVIHAQTPNPATAIAPLAITYDLDGEAADADQVVASATLADATSYTIAANPDTCRLVDVTITDADSSISAGVLTVVGTDCWGAPLTTTFTFAAGGSGVKTLVVSSGKASAAYYATVTSVSNGALTGEGVGDALTVGYTANSVSGWPLYGRFDTTPSGLRYVDVFGVYTMNRLVKNGAATTDITTVTASAGPFTNVRAGDLIAFNVSGEILWRRVTTRTDANNIIVNTGVTLPTTGVTFAYKHFLFTTDPQDGWIPVTGFDTFTVAVQVDANASTGGVISSIQCGSRTVDSAAITPDFVVEVDTATVATGATGTDTTTVDLRNTPHYTHCRAGIRFGTGDDADAAAEDIDIMVGMRR